MRQSQRIFKNVLAGGVGTSIGGVLQFGAAILIARRLSLYDFGTYSILATMMFALNRLSELGTSAILTRDMAIRPDDTPALLGAALSLSWLTVAAASLLITAAMWASPFSRQTSWLVVMMGVSGVLQFPCACYGAAMRASEDLELDILGFLLHKVALLALVIAALQMGWGLTGIAAAYLSTAFFQALFCRWIVAKKYFRPHWLWDFQRWKYLIRSSAPFGISNAVQLIGEQADVTVLAWLAGLSAVGLYSGAYKISVGLRFVPIAMVIAIFPVYSRAALYSATNGSNDFREAYQRGFRVFTTLAVPLTVVFLFASKVLITGLLGAEFAAAAPALRIMAPVAGLLFLASPFPYLLTALNEQRILMVTSIAATALRIVLLFILTPHFGLIGVSYGLLISQFVQVVLWERCLASLGFALPLAMITIKLSLGALAMGIVLYLGNAQTLAALVPTLLLGATLYIATVVKLGVFTDDEFRLASDGVTFLRPLWAEWYSYLRARP